METGIEIRCRRKNYEKLLTIDACNGILNKSKARRFCRVSSLKLQGSYLCAADQCVYRRAGMAE